MTDTKAKPKDTAKDAPDMTDEQLATAEVVQAADDKRQRAAAIASEREELLRKLAAVDQKAQAEGLGVALVPSHLLVLADGSRVESAGAVPTHYSHQDGRVLPVVQALPLEGLTANA